MQKSGVEHVISDICTFLRREVFHVEGRFFDKNNTLAEFSQLCLNKSLVFELWILLVYLEAMFVNINYLTIELMIEVVNIVVNINYLAIELIDVMNIVFNSSDIVVKWMCSEFKNCTCFIANSSIFKICIRLICVSWLKPPDINTYLLTDQ
jgi:hypothetical protein